MKNIDIVRFQVWHADSIAIRDIGDVERRLLDSRYFQFLEQAGPGYTLMVDGEVIACLVFCRLLYPGVAEVVILGSEKMSQYGRMIHRICKRCIEDVQKSHGFRRIQAQIDASMERNIRWAERLGFECEGVTRSFGPNGEDYVMMGRIMEGI